MTAREFTTRMATNGFSPEKVAGGERYCRDVAGVSQYVAKESVRGTAWRLFLAVSPVPDGWPTLSIRGVTSEPWIEAESPWFEYFTDLDPSDPLDAELDSPETALRKCYDWLLNVGSQWLNDPSAKPDQQWRIDHNIVVKRHDACD